MLKLYYKVNFIGMNLVMVMDFEIRNVSFIEVYWNNNDIDDFILF